MNRIKFLLTILLFSPMMLTAQATKDLAISMQLRSISYILGEKIPVQISIHNNTTRSITLNAPDSLNKCGIEVKPVYKAISLPMLKDSVISGQLVLQPNQSYNDTFMLDKAVALNEEGKFTASFNVTFNNVFYSTNPVAFDIVPGFIITDGVQLFAKDASRQRKFTLVRWPRNNLDCLFLRIEDEPGKKRFDTLPLGAYLGQTKPRMNISDNGEITILHRATPDYFVRTVLWSLTNEVYRKSRINLLDPNAAVGDRTLEMKDDIESALEQSDKERDRRRRKAL